MKSVFIGVAAGLVVLILGVGYWQFMAKRSIDVEGSITIFSDYSKASQGTCSGGGLHEGDQVTLSADGATMGIGKLNDGDPSSDRCIISFLIADVDASHKFYTLKLGDHPPYELARSDLETPVSLTLE